MLQHHFAKSAYLMANAHLLISEWANLRCTMSKKVWLDNVCCLNFLTVEKHHFQQLTKSGLVFLVPEPPALRFTKRPQSFDFLIPPYRQFSFSALVCSKTHPLLCIVCVKNQQAYLFHQEGFFKAGNDLNASFSRGGKLCSHFGTRIWGVCKIEQAQTISLLTAEDFPIFLSSMRLTELGLS